MTTLEDLVQEVTLALQGYCTKSEQVTYLKVDIDADENRIKVDDVDQVSRGVLEIGDELIRVEGTDRANSVAICLPRGRGWRGTTATVHTADDTVTMSPLVPRASIKRAVNDTIDSLYPTLFGVAETTFTVDDPSRLAWEVPATAEVILSVRWRDAYQDWQDVRHWSLEHKVSTTDFATGKSLRIRGVPAGQQVQVVYGTRLTRMTDATEFDDTGLPESVRELVVIGTTARLIPALDVARLSVRTVNPDELDQPVQLGSASSLSRELQRTFRERLVEERAALQSRYPGRIHYV